MSKYKLSSGMIFFPPGTHYYFAKYWQNLCLTVEIYTFLLAHTYINERFFFPHDYCVSLPKICKTQIWNFLGTHIFKNMLFFAQILLILQKIGKIRDWLSKYEHRLRGWYLSKKDFVCVSMLLFYWKSVKFAIFLPFNVEDKLSSEMIIFLMHDFFFFFFKWIHYYSAGNRQNSRLTIEIWTFLQDETLKCSNFFLQICWYFGDYWVNLWLSKYDLFFRSWYLLNVRLSSIIYYYFAKNWQN